LGLIAEGLRK